MAIKIFISHRHADKKIADVLRQHLIFWEVSKREIFQSSAAGYGAEAGHFLTDKLAEAVQQSKLVFLIYTFEEANWSYCMWEVGLAEGDASTKLVVLQCRPDEDVPDVFKGRVHVKLELEAIRAFVNDFHTKADFFPGHPPYKPDLDQQVLERRSQDLYKALVEVVPPGKVDRRYRWDFLVLEFSADARKELAEGSDSQAVDIVSSKSKVGFAFGQALKHFGYDNLQENLFFGDLITRWRERQGKESDKWIGQLCSEIKRAAENRPAEVGWEKMKSDLVSEWYFYPMLNYAHLHPDGKMHLDVYLYRVAQEQAGG